jgi:hypothetical protein
MYSLGEPMDGVVPLWAMGWAVSDESEMDTGWVVSPP